MSTAVSVCRFLVGRRAHYARSRDAERTLCGRLGVLDRLRPYGPADCRSCIAAAARLTTPTNTRS